MTTRWSAGALALALVFAAPFAHAQSDDAKRSAARTFATDGLTAYNAGQFDKAIDLFTRAEALVHAPPHQLYIARASVKVGQLVHAKELYVKITREELPAGAPKAFTEAQASATTELAEIEPRIPKLTITVTGAGAASAKVTMDNVEVPAALIGAPQPVDPGAHVLRATASGYKPAPEVRINVAEKASENATLTIDEPAPVEVAAPVVKTEGPSGFRKVAPFIAFGVGAAGLAVGTVFLFKNRGDRDDADALCPGDRCPSARRGEIEDLDRSADKAQTFSMIGYGVGAAGVVAGAVLLILNRSSSSESKTGATVTPWMTASSGGLAGRF